MELLEEADNFVIFKAIDGHTFLYERLLNSIHSLDTDSNVSTLISKLKNVEIGLRFTFSPEKVASRLNSGLDSLVLNLTEKCNFNCGYCIYSGIYEGERTHSSKEMEEITAIRAVREFLEKSKPNPKILFYGGEPLLRSDLILRVVKEFDTLTKGEYHFGLTTNFSLAEPLIDFFVDKNFLLNISLDGPKDVHDRWRKHAKNGKGSFDDIMYIIHKISLEFPGFYKKNVVFSATLTDPLMLIEVWQFFSQPLFRDNFVNVNPLEQKNIRFKFAGYVNEKMEQSKQNLLKLAEEYCRNILEVGNNPGFLRGIFDGFVHPIYSRSDSLIQEELWPRGTCIPGVRKLFVDTDGTYYMCEKIGRRMPIGSTNEGLDIPLVERVLNTYFEIKNELCSHCWAVRLCSSCPATAKDVVGISKAGQLASCGNLKERSLWGLSIYSTMATKGNEIFKYLKKLELDM